MRFLTRKKAVEALPLCYYEHPVLRRKSKDITEITAELREFADQMILTMNENDGIGLAAPQVGRNINLVVLGIPAPPMRLGEPMTWNSPGEAALLQRMPMVVVNPVLTDFSEEEADYEEGCLSIPDLRATVRRPIFCTLHAKSLAGQQLDLRCGGLLSRCLQHEVDHLNGILFVDLIDEEEKEALAEPLKRMNRRTQAQLKSKRRLRH